MKLIAVGMTIRFVILVCHIMSSHCSVDSEPSSAIAPSNSPSSVPPNPMTSSAHFVSHQQRSHQQFSFDENDEPIPRKRSFSSGSKRYKSGASECVGKLRFAFCSHLRDGSSKGVDFVPVAGEVSATPSADGHPHSDDPCDGRNGRALLRQLLCSEDKIRNMRETVIAQTCNLEYINKGEPNKVYLTTLHCFVNLIFSQNFQSEGMGHGRPMKMTFCNRCIPNYC